MTNKNIAEKIRSLGHKLGLKSDRQITRHAGFYGDTIKNIECVKTSPRLDTLQKFADALNVDVEDLICDRSAVETELTKLLKNLTDYEKTEIVVYIRMMQRDRENEKKDAQKAA